MRKNIEYIVTLPKHVKVSDVNIKSISIGENWETLVKEENTGRVLGRMAYGIARQKFG
ncbi:MAG: hypothetical protein PHV83_06520 [Bacteroidales bacterium]|nr:hypothetical protein [Bacteroidales bacterium]